MNSRQLEKFFTIGRSISSDVQQLVKPLYESLNISYFGQTRMFRDGTVTALLSNVSLGEHWVEHKYALPGSDEKGIFIEKGFYLASQLGKLYTDKQQMALREKFNIDHALFYIQKFEKYDDVIMIAAEPSNYNIINQYINNIDFLKNFISYYYENASKLLEIADETRISIPKSLITDKTLVTETFKMPTSNLNITNFTYYNRHAIYLTKREKECAYWLIHGKSAEEIGIILEISKRTVERYIDNIKLKLNCSKLTQIVYLILKNRLIEDFI